MFRTDLRRYDPDRKKQSEGAIKQGIKGNSSVCLGFYDKKIAFKEGDSHVKGSIFTAGYHGGRDL